MDVTMDEMFLAEQRAQAFISGEMSDKERDSYLNRKLDIISSYMGGKGLTEEQKEFAKDFTQNTVSFSDPGTGKTHSTTAGIIMAQTVHKVPGDKIVCMSFTKAATYEISARYRALCSDLMMTPNVKFSTFHALSRVIMKEAYSTMKIRSGYFLEEDLPVFIGIMERAGVDGSDKAFAKKVLTAVDSLNSALTFDEHNVRESFKFQSLGIEVEEFQMIRKLWFVNRLTCNTINRGDIPLYCLFALNSYPEIVDKWKGKYEIMIIDEFQDMSLLHMKILGIISKKLIVIGDIKQQLYGFNGACPQIVDEYLKMCPDARVCPLSKSFRCKDEIVDFAKKIIAPNNMSFTDFKGVGAGGFVSLYSRRELDWKDIIDRIAKDRKEHPNDARDVMFLYRNNASATPVIEALYKEGLPFRCTKFKKVMELPIFEDLCIMADVAMNPSDIDAVNKLMKIIPEYSKLPYGTEAPPVIVMRQTHRDIFTIPFEWSNLETKEILTAVRRAQLANEQKKNASIVLNHCLQAYEKFIIHNEWWRFDMPKEFYLNLVAPIIVNKTYGEMCEDEWNKQKRNEECINANVGVRCYTMHSSKGLEADEVYMLDVENDLFPNKKEIARMLEAGCKYEAACRVRDERNLIFVAATRAKDKLVISYSDEPAELIVSPEQTKYSWLDEIYDNHENKYNDAERFYQLFNLGG